MKHNTSLKIKERPIIFKSEMVRAILEGRKTQTRRIVKFQPEIETGYDYPHENETGYFWKKEESYDSFDEMIADMIKHCPFGKVGDRLWVRENFCCFDEDWRFMGRPHDLKDGPWRNILYEADNGIDHGCGWRPSIHMPRWASRITLEITSIRVERLQDISEKDANAEGVEFDSGWEEPMGEGYTDGWGFVDYMNEDQDYSMKSAKDSFESLWKSINGPESWNQNPWVWVIEFKRRL